MAMENIVAVLTQINEKAEKILSDANGCKVSMQKQMEQDIKSYSDKLDQKTAKTLDRITKESTDSFNAKKSAISKETDASIKSMEDNFNKNHDALVNELFNKVIAFQV